MFDELRQSYANDPVKLAEIEAWEAREKYADERRPTVIPPCPPWCRYFDTITPTSLYKLHEYDSIEWGEPLTFSRFHVENQTGSYVSQEEFNREGVVTLGPLHITISSQEGIEEATAGQAREIAAELLAAADRLEAIEAQA
jgi:hypothetical protein